MDDDWKKQQALERQSRSQVMMAADTMPITGGDVCVWDAFGAFWCEKKTQNVAAAAGYVKQVAKQGQALVYEGFCGCGAEQSS